MRILGFSLAVTLALMASAAVAADASVVTIADGSARVLRGTVWYKLVAGAPFQEGDVIEAGERTTVQVELATGGTLNLVGPGALYGAVVPAPGSGKDPVEFGMERGWLKYAVAAPGAGAKLRTPVAVVSANEAILVAHHDNKLFELFIETGGAKLSETGRGGRDGPPNEAKAGEYWSRDGDRPFTSERRAPVKFVASMPRHQIDKLAALAAKFKGKKPAALAVDREITLAEADAWLAGPYRRAFARRFTGRLADPTFRKAVEANLAAYPDFDRILHPEKYPVGTPPVAGGAPAAAPAAPTSPTAAAAPPTAAAAPSSAANKAPSPPAPPASPTTKTPPAASPPSPPAKSTVKTSALHLIPGFSLFLSDDVSETVL